MKYIFEWDENKALSNKQKHLISFDVAVRVFEDPYAITSLNNVIDGEQRWQTIGSVEDNLLIIVIHTTFDNIQNIEIIRIISARKATTQERKYYEKNYS